MTYITTTQDTLFYTLPFLIPVVGGILILMLDLFAQSDRKHYLGYLATIIQVIALTTLLYTLFQGEDLTLFDGLIELTGTTLIPAAMVLLSGIFTTLTSINYLERHKIHIGEFYTLLLISITGLLLAITAAHLFLLFIAFEIFSFGCYILVGFLRGSPLRAEVVVKYFLPGALFSLFFLFSIALIYGQSGSLYFASVTTMTPHRLLFPISFILFLFPMLFKIAIIPLHQWVPDIYQGAPANVVMLISTGIKIAIFTVLLRLLPPMIEHFKNPRFWIDILLILGLITMILGTLLALVQQNLKRLMGYSTMIHSGLIIMGISAYLVSPDQALKTALFTYFFIYLLMNSGIFAIISILEHNHQGTDLKDLAGLHQFSPFLYGIFILLLVAMVGLPPTGGFIAKLFLFKGIYLTGISSIGVMTAIGLTIISSIIYLRPILHMHQQPTEETTAPKLLGGDYLVLTVISVGIILTGIIPGPLLSLINHFTGQ